MGAKVKMEIIDFHTHPLVDDVNYFCFYKESVKADKNTIVADMTEAGISRFCGSVIRKRREGERLSDRERELIFSENAKRIHSI